MGALCVSMCACVITMMDGAVLFSFIEGVGRLRAWRAGGREVEEEEEEETDDDD